MRIQTSSGNGRFMFLYGIFAASGFSGLIYESIWSHYLKLFLGHAAYAQTTVLAIFMGGMALGAWLASRYSRNWRNLLVLYALAEGLIGLAGLGFHGVFVKTTEYAFNEILPGLSSPASVQFWKYLIGSALILPQSILLGTTFPLMSAGLIRLAPERSGSTLAMLYFTNSIGAVGGALASALFLVEKVGLPGTLLTAGLINVVLALLVWLASKTGVEVEAEAAPAIPAGQAATERWSLESYRIFLAIAFLTGLSSFFYEIGWIRMLALVLGSSTRAFELMLASFILGIAAGGLWIKRRIDTLPAPETFLGYVQVFMGLAAAATLPLYSGTFDVMQWALQALMRNDAGYALFMAASQGIAMAVMFPATFFAGMTLPLLTYVLITRGAGERAIGQVYAANTVGAIVGVVVALHLLMPWIGVKGLILAGALVDLALGAAILFRAGALVRPFSPAQLAGGALAVAVLAVAMVHQTDPHRRVSGVYRNGFAFLSHINQVLYLRDGKTATISLAQSPERIVAIATNGKTDAAIDMSNTGRTAPDEITMTLAGALALAYQPQGREFANIGMGSGMTTHVLLGSERPRSVDTVEIEPLMVEAARLGFEKRVPRTFNDPRSHIHIEDAKTFFSLHGKKYDAIVSEPSNPWVSGVASLFGREFYRHARRYLADDGILVQWLQIYESNLNVLSSILLALSQEFSDFVVYNTDNSDILVIAKKQGRIPEPDWNALAAPALAEELKLVGIRSEQDIRRRLIGDKAVLDPLVASYGAPMNSDYFPYVEQQAPAALFRRESAADLTFLNMSDFPLLEMLVKRPLGVTTEKPEVTGALSRDALVAAAVAIRDGAWVNHDNISAELQKSLRLLDTAAANCLTGPDAVWLNAFREAASAVLGQLHPSELEGIFDRWIPPSCANRLSAEQKLWVDLYRAAGRRDGETMARLAQTLFETSRDLDETRRDALLRAGMLGRLAAGQREQAAEFWRGFAPRVLKGSSLPTPLRLLMAHAFIAPYTAGQ